MGYFDIYNDGSQLPIVCYKLKEDVSIPWNLYDLTDEFAMKGWQVPTYPLPDNLSNINIQRFCLPCRLKYANGNGSGARYERRNRSLE